ncbi:MAG: hypothetical protein COU33_04145 [Candidatus Magasanikbacteria bacterium CG10_big_fil_rev_8_21_14_0_10_43_6]|uniref:Uncharacterized protein n=1 Tax=Candidatus Magasanikbacteria bacterium CG10_big_fil_rev_8_21_14_0_10_43_6 TaxID=1974650 RepID=A0A2M6W0D3_9BACT|nr:MAG: hypothetical protein COU33_04145 [Candidatus Magasanikbacteria bacterium CG10_big_fil_rev_8_21_14_0_10_43_6]
MNVFRVWRKIQNTSNSEKTVLIIGDIKNKIKGLGGDYLSPIVFFLQKSGKLLFLANFVIMRV